MSENLENNNHDVGTASESYKDSETYYTERKSRSRERGPDKKPRTYRANSMRNLDQWSQRPEKFAQYLKDEKGVDVTGNSGMWKIFLVIGASIIAVLGGICLYNRYKNGTDNILENKY